MKAKKILSILCSMAMVASMGMAALAEADTGNETVTGVDEKSINVTLEAEIRDTTPSYSVNITWTSMKFVFTEKSAKTWIVDSHDWSASDGEWSNSSATITATNHSSAAVKVTSTYAKEGEDGYDLNQAKYGVTVTYQNFEKERLEAGSKENLSSPGNNQDTATVSVSGTPTKSITSTVVGKITVKIETNLEP